MIATTMSMSEFTPILDKESLASERFLNLVSEYVKSQCSPERHIDISNRLTAEFEGMIKVDADPEIEDLNSQNGDYLYVSKIDQDKYPVEIRKYDKEGRLVMLQDIIDEVDMVIAYWPGTGFPNKVEIMDSKKGIKSLIKYVYEWKDEKGYVNTSMRVTDSMWVDSEDRLGWIAGETLEYVL